MPKDKASATTIITAPVGEVLAVIRDVGSQADWVKEVSLVELLEEYEDGTPATARFEVTTGIGADKYTLEYEHSDDGMTWTMVEGHLQKSQDGAYELRDLGTDHTEVTLTLEIEHSIHAPGFVRRRIFSGVVKNTVAELKAHVEAP